MNFTLIDTPGFDDCFHSDTDILRKISDWLVHAYRQRKRLTAILYLTRISDPRMQGSPLGNFRMFKELCGEDCYRNVVLGTTFWEVTDSRHPGLAEKREKELIDEFWRDMIDRGSEVIRIPETRWLARDLLVKLAKKSEMSLKIQRERIDQNVKPEDTAAFSVTYETERLKAKHAEEMRQKQVSIEKDMEEHEKKLKNEEEARANELEKRLEDQRKELKKVEENRLRQEKESQRLIDEAKRERERVDKEQAELAEQLKTVTKEKALQERKRKRIELSKQKASSMDEMRVAHQMKHILATIREHQKVYTLCCDNCFRNVGAGVYYGKFLAHQNPSHAN